MYGNFKEHLQEELKTIEESGLFKRERIITSEQGAVVKVNGKEVIVFCANNYLGLSSHPKVIEAAHKTLDSSIVFNSSWRCSLKFPYII